MNRFYGILLLFFLFQSIYCQEEDDGLCSEKKKCKVPNTICRDSVCECKPLFVQDSNGKCVKAPTVGEKCLLADGSILDCKGTGVDASCPTENICKCLTGYEKVGKICKYKDKKIGDACESDTDCGIAFAGCQNRKCVCGTGFRLDKGICISEKKCPGGVQPIKGRDGKAKSCEVKRNERAKSGTPELIDDCGSKAFCFYHPMIRSKGGVFAGHCCPDSDFSSDQIKSKPACPAGDPLPVDTCASDANDLDFDLSSSETNLSKSKDQPSNSQGDSGCPALTHTCVFAVNGSFCCPVPCPGSFSFFAVDGKCLEILELGQPCTTDAQCGFGAACPKDAGVCSCKSGYILSDGNCEKKDT